ncbi:hypothetical protein [Rhizobium leguminosarum]|uniref:hypothetical protein n=1 Tax=Rhizobium leguminosarum TaxID=384 RepID=UPI003F9748CB
MKDAVRAGALFASAVLFVFFLYLVFTGADEGRFITVAVIFVFTVLATRLDDITNLTFGATGVQAALEKKLREAEATVTQLQRIAELFGRIGVEQISMSNRMLGLSSRQKREFITSIEQELRAIGVSDERVKNVLSTQRDFDIFDYYHWVAQALTVNPTQNDVVAYTSFISEFSNVDIGSTPSPDEVEAFLARNGVTGGEGIERLKDWRHYEATGKHLRLDLWDHRHDLPK